MMCLTGLLISFAIFPDGASPYLLDFGSSDTFLLSRSAFRLSLGLLWCLSVLYFLIRVLITSLSTMPFNGESIDFILANINYKINNIFFFWFHQNVHIKMKNDVREEVCLKMNKIESRIIRL